MLWQGLLLLTQTLLAAGATAAVPLHLCSYSCVGAVATALLQHASGLVSLCTSGCTSVDLLQAPCFGLCMALADRGSISAHFCLDGLVCFLPTHCLLALHFRRDASTCRHQHCKFCTLSLHASDVLLNMIKLNSICHRPSSKPLQATTE